MRALLPTVVCLVLVSAFAWADPPNTFTPSTVISASQVNANFDALKTRWQMKALSSNVISTGTLTDLTFTGLEVGRTYRIGGLGHVRDNNTGGTPYGTILWADHDALSIMLTQARNDVTNDNDAVGAGINALFVATTTSLTFRVEIRITGAILGDGTRGSTHIILEELPFHEQVSVW